MTDIKQDLSYSGYFDYVFDVRMVAPIKRLAGADFSRIGHVPGGAGNIHGQYPTVGHIYHMVLMNKPEKSYKIWCWFEFKIWSMGYW